MSHEFEDLPQPLSIAESLEMRHQTVYAYIDALSDTEMATSERIAKDITSNGRPLAQTVVIIPVAAPQEAANVGPAIGQYARQVGHQAFTVVLGLNEPTATAGSDRSRDTFDAVDKAKSENPDVDIRTTYTAYQNPVIGQVRRDLWNGVAVASRQSGNFETGPEVIGINHDIDTVRLAKHYIAEIQKYYDRRDRRHIISPVSPVAGSWTKHANSPNHPLISQAVLWNDYVHRAAGRYEAGMVIPFSYYADRGGIDATAVTHEIGSITQSGHSIPTLIPFTSYETSPRRYLARMSTCGYGIWADTSSFTPEDECRVRNEYPDISRARQMEIVSDYLPTHMHMLAAKAVLLTFNEIASDDIVTLLQDETQADNQFDFFMNRMTKQFDHSRKSTRAILRRIFGPSPIDCLANDAFLDAVRKICIEE